MKNCKSKKIYKIDYATPMHTKRQQDTNFQRATEKNIFERALINEFCDVDLDYIEDNYTSMRKHLHRLEKLVYNDMPWLRPVEIGFAMLKDKFGIEVEMHWDNMYLAIPLVHEDIINKIEQIKPNWFTNVKKI